MACSQTDFESGTITIQNMGSATSVTLDIGYRGMCAADDADFQEYPVFPLGGNQTIVLEFGFAAIGLSPPTCPGYIVFASVRAPSTVYEDANCRIDPTPPPTPYPLSSVSGGIESALLFSNEIDLAAVRGTTEATCIGAGEALTAIANQDPNTAYRGVMAGRYSCLREGQSIDPMDYCLDGTECLGGTLPGGDGFGRSFAAFELALSCQRFRVFEEGGGLPRCCDCADLAVQCARYVVTEAKLPGDTTYRPIEPPYWSTYHLDTDPESAEAGFSCWDFRDPSLVAGLIAGACNHLDLDLDGEVESLGRPWCDSIHPSSVPTSGGAVVVGVDPLSGNEPTGVVLCSTEGPQTCEHIPVLSNNDDVIDDDEVLCGPNLTADTEAFDDDVQELAVGTSCVTSDDLVVSPGGDGVADSFTENFTFIAPPRPFGTVYTVDVAYDGATECLDPEEFGLCKAPKPPNDRLEYNPDFIHVLSTATGTLQAFGVQTAEAWDMNPEDFSSLEVAPGFNLRDMAYASAGATDARLYVAGEEEVPGSLPEGRLYLFDVANNRPVDFDPVGGIQPLALDGPARSLDIVDDSVAYVAYTSGANWDIDVVDLNPLEPALPTVTAADVGLTVARRALRVRAAKLDASTNRVYVLHQDTGCTGGMAPEGPGFWCIPECGGGGPDTSRTLLLNVYDFDSGGNPTPVAGILLDDFPSAPCSAPSLDDAGMDFNADGDELWIVSPDYNRVRVVDLDTLTVEPPINVGIQPTGISLAIVGTAPDRKERAYVANRGSDSYTVIDVANRTVETTFLLPVGSAPDDLIIEPGGQILNVVAGGVGELRRYLIPANTPFGVLPSTAPRRILVQHGMP